MAMIEVVRICLLPAVAAVVEMYSSYVQTCRLVAVSPIPQFFFFFIFEKPLLRQRHLGKMSAVTPAFARAHKKRKKNKTFYNIICLVMAPCFFFFILDFLKQGLGSDPILCASEARIRMNKKKGERK